LFNDGNKTILFSKVKTIPSFFTIRNCFAEEKRAIAGFLRGKRFIRENIYLLHFSIQAWILDETKSPFCYRIHNDRHNQTSANSDIEETP